LPCVIGRLAEEDFIIPFQPLAARHVSPIFFLFLFFLSSLLSRTSLPLTFSLFFSFSSSFSPSPLCSPAHHSSPSPFLSSPSSHMLRERDRERAGSQNPRPVVQRTEPTNGGSSGDFRRAKELRWNQEA